MTTRRIAAALFAALAAAAPARATGRHARRRELSCLACHVDARGRAGLNPTGEGLRRRGHPVAFDPELVVPHEPRPLTPGGARMLGRKTEDLGRRVFRMKDLGRARRSCQTCHAGGAELAAGLWESYPRFREDAGRWLTLEGAINRCMVTKLAADPLRPGSPTSVALQLYLRTLAGAVKREYADDPAWAGRRPAAKVVRGAVAHWDPDPSDLLATPYVPRPGPEVGRARGEARVVYEVATPPSDAGDGG